MQQRKFKSRMFAVIFSTLILGLFFSSIAMADITPPESCNTFTTILPNGTPDLSNIGSNPSITIAKSSDGKWPIVIESALADTGNLCDNRYASNYPCTVFKYNLTANLKSWQSTVVTIPTCLDNSMDITTKYSADSACSGINSSGNPDWASFACGMRDIRISGGTPDNIAIPVKGTKVGIGVISMTLADHTPGNQTQNINYFCYNTQNNTGILGPSCNTAATTQPISKLKTMCTTLEGSTYKIAFSGATGATIDNCSDLDCKKCDENPTELLNLSDIRIEICEKDASGLTNCSLNDPIKSLGALFGDISNESGYITFHDSPGCVLLNFNNKYYLKCS